MQKISEDFDERKDDFMNNIRITAALTAVIMCAGLLGACNKNADKDSSDSAQSTTSELAKKVASADTDTDTANIITLGDSIKIAGSGATAAGGVVTVSQGGTYELTGTLKDGYINVTAKDEVTLILNGASITNSSGPCIYSDDAKTLTVYTKSGSENTLTDGKSYSNTDAKGAIFSNDDLVLDGEGKLTVNGNYKHAVASDDEIVIGGGEYVLTAAFDGVHANDDISVLKPDLTITADGDGIQSDLAGITVSGGTLNITTAGGMAAAPAKQEKDFGVAWNDYDNEYTDSEEDSSSPQSFKGIKGETSVKIENGTLNIDTYDDSVHSNDTVTVSGGTLNLSSGDDGIHADVKLNITGGKIDIAGCYEGLEAGTIDISGGDISIVASDDGLNAVENESFDSDDLSDRSPFGGGNMESGYGTLIIRGGSIVVDADGDGLDSNGTIEISGGTIVVYGPENDGNGALDYDSSCTVTGGNLLAGGMSGMAQSAGDDSNSSLLLYFDSTLSSSDKVSVTDSNGTEIASYQSSKRYNSLVVCCNGMESGNTVKILINGEEKGSIELTDGVYYANVSDSGITQSSNQGMGGPGGIDGNQGMGGPGGMPGRR